MTHEEIERWFTRDEVSCAAFICRCGEQNDIEADDFLMEVKKQLGASRNVTPVPDNLFLTMVVIELEWRHSAHISAIYTDHWSAVTAKVYDDGKRKPYDVRIECDNVEDGIAGVWWAYQHRMAAQESGGAGDDGGVLLGLRRHGEAGGSRAPHKGKILVRSQVSVRFDALSKCGRIPVAG
jgi:hypothetical protein